jgi:hypothetical protein
VYDDPCIDAGMTIYMIAGGCACCNDYVYESRCVYWVGVHAVMTMCMRVGGCTGCACCNDYVYESRCLYWVCML